MNYIHIIFNIKKYKDPWITPELLEMIRDKDVALKKAKRTKRAADWHNARKLRNTCLSQIRKAIGDMIKNELDTNKSDSKKFWKNIHDIIPKNSKNNNKIELVHQPTKQEVNSDEVATYINEFFSNIGPNLAKNFSQEWQYEGPVSDTQILNITTNIEEVLKICKEIDTSKAACIENLSSTLRLDYGYRRLVHTGCVFSLISLLSIPASRHDIYQIKAEYLSYSMVSVI